MITPNNNNNSNVRSMDLAKKIDSNGSEKFSAECGIQNIRDQMKNFMQSVAAQSQVEQHTASPSVRNDCDEFEAEITYINFTKSSETDCSEQQPKGRKNLIEEV